MTKILNTTTLIFLQETTFIFYTIAFGWTRNYLHILYHSLRLDKLSNRRAIGEHTSIAVNCIPPAEVALNLAFGDFERNGGVYGHRGRDEGVE